MKSYLRDLRDLYFPKKFPFGTKIVASKDYYLKILNNIKSKRYKTIDEFEIKKNFFINKNWLNELALHTQVVKKKSEINYQHGRLIYAELMYYIKHCHVKEINIFETGTARGFSSLCMSKAINDSNIKGTIHTIDIISGENKIYWNCIDDHDGPKTRIELLGNWKNELKNIKFYTGPSRFVMKRIKLKRINFAFIDAMHDYQNVKREFNFISKTQLKGDIVILDDFNINFPGVGAFLKELKLLKIYKLDFIKSDNKRAYAICKKLV